MVESNQKSKRLVEIAWSLYERLPLAADDVLKWGFRYVLPFKNLNMSVAILRGPTQLNGRLGTVIIAGSEHEAGYLIHRFFEAEYQREPLGKVPLWDLGNTLKQLRTSADLMIAHVDQFYARMFLSADYLAVPEWVGSSLALPEDINELANKNYKLRRELKRVSRNNFTYELSRVEEAFERFYCTMFIPFIRKRYGEQSVIRNIHQMRRMFHQGGLFFIKRNNQPVAGLLFEQRNEQLRSIAFGTINGESKPVEEGAFASLYLLLVKHAYVSGCKLVDFGGCRPSLSDGVLRYKHKWGVSLREKPDTWYDFLVYWNRFNGPITSFFSKTPLIFRDHKGLSGLCVMDQKEPATNAQVRKIHHSVWMPGLKWLYLISASGWRANISSPPQTCLIDLKSSENLTPHKLKLNGLL